MFVHLRVNVCVHVSACGHIDVRVFACTLQPATPPLGRWCRNLSVQEVALLPQSSAWPGPVLSVSAAEPGLAGGVGDPCAPPAAWSSLGCRVLLTSFLFLWSLSLFIRDEGVSGGTCPMLLLLPCGVPNLYLTCTVVFHEVSEGMPLPRPGNPLFAFCQVVFATSLCPPLPISAPAYFWRGCWTTPAGAQG